VLLILPTPVLLVLPHPRAPHSPAPPHHHPRLREG
jgi:hypothetical protein